MQFAQASAPKGGSTRNACGCFSKKEPNPPRSTKKNRTKKSTPSKRYSEIVALCFIRACFESEYRLRGSTTKILLNGKGFSKKEKPCKIARIFVGFDTHSVWLFENSLIHPAPQRKTALISADFLGGEGWIRLIAQGCTCANCPSVSTERWFCAQSARRLEKPPIHPLGKQKSTSRDVLFCWWRGVDSNHRSH